MLAAPPFGKVSRISKTNVPGHLQAELATRIGRKLADDTGQQSCWNRFNHGRRAHSPQPMFFRDLRTICDERGTRVDL